MFMENEHYALVDALPYIDTQVQQVDVAQQVKALIDEEMGLFEPRDYLASLPAPSFVAPTSELIQQELDRIDSGRPMGGIDTKRYAATVERPQGNSAQDHGEWRKAAEAVHMQLEYNRLRLTNLEMLERWGAKAWVAHSMVARVSERLMANEASALKSSREEVNKKRKLDQISCGNELRKLTYELEQYQQDNVNVEQALQGLEAEVERLQQAAAERGVVLPGQAAPPAEGGGAGAGESKDGAVAGAAASGKE